MSIFFDPTYYLQNNPDVLQAVIAGTIPSALYHWETYGWRELRNPNAVFNTSEYFSNNPDVARAGINPLQHFIDFGAAEGRVPNDSFVTRTNFDWQAYLASNPDVAGFANESTPPAWTNWPAGAPWTPQDAAYWQFSLYGFSEHRAGVQTVTGEPINSQGVPYTASAFNLTTAIETLNGTPANDVFTGTFGVSQAADTYQMGDTVNGLGGTNTLNLTALGTAASGTAIVKNIQTINVMDTVGSTLNASLIENDPTINFTRTLDGKTSQVTSASLASTVGLQGLGDLTVGYANTSGKADTAKVALTGVGAEGNASVINVSNTNTIEAVTVATTGTNVFDIQAGTKAATVTVTGTGDNTATFSDVASTVTIDASAATGKQTYTVQGLGFGDVVKGGAGTQDTLSTVITNSGNAQPTVSGFETLDLTFAAAGTYNGSKTTGVTTLDLTPTGAVNATVTNLVSTAQAINIGKADAISATGAVSISYATGSDTDVTLNVGATNASSDPAVSIGAVTFANNVGSLTVKSVGDAANGLGALAADKVSALTLNAVDQGLTVASASAKNASSVTLDASAHDLSLAGSLAVDESLSQLKVAGDAGVLTLGAVTQTAVSGAINTTYDFTAGAKAFNAIGGLIVSTAAADTDLTAVVNVNAEGAGAVILGPLSFTGSGAAAADVTDVTLKVVSDSTGPVTIASLAVDEGANGTSSTTVSLTGNGGAVTLASLALTDSDTNSITLAANSSSVAITALNNAASTQTDITVSAESGQAATIGSLAGAGNLHSITASGAGTISLFADATSAVTGDATIDTTGATGDVTVNLASATGALNFQLGNASASHSNTIFGGAGADTFIGGSGADKLTGNGGNDTVNLGAGHDTWAFGNSTLGANPLASAVHSAVGLDTINDFVVADDQFQLNDSLFHFGSSGTLAAGLYLDGTDTSVNIAGLGGNGVVGGTGGIVVVEGASQTDIYFVQSSSALTTYSTLAAAITGGEATQIGTIGTAVNLTVADFHLAA